MEAEELVDVEDVTPFVEPCELYGGLMSMNVWGQKKEGG